MYRIKGENVSSAEEEKIGTKKGMSIKIKSAENWIIRRKKRDRFTQYEFFFLFSINAAEMLSSDYNYLIEVY